MEALLPIIQELLVQALPTTVLVALLYFYLNKTLFQPMAKVLAERDAATSGARHQAEKALKMAEEKTAQYDQAMRNARTELMKEQEAFRMKLRDEQSAQMEKARLAGRERVDAAKAELARETAAARESLRSESEALAEVLTRQILSGSRN
jgi:F-type H+-transporting ATPase subunit b